MKIIIPAYDPIKVVRKTPEASGTSAPPSKTDSKAAPAISSATKAKVEAIKQEKE